MMKFIRSERIRTASAFVALVLLGFPASSLRGQAIISESLTVYPAAEADSPLSPALLPPITEQIRGNAAFYYARVKANRDHIFGSADFSNALRQAERKSLAELQQDQVLTSMLADNGLLNDLVRAGRCELADWQLPIRDEPYLQIALQQIQDCLQYSRILAARTRLDIANGDFENALKFSQAHFALARHVSDAEPFMHALGALSIQRRAQSALSDFVQQPDAPNLYWKLNHLPHPLISIDRAVDAELSSLQLTFPWLRDVIDQTATDEQWNQRLDEVWNILQSLGSGRVRDVSLDELVVFGYPLAKRRLIANGQPGERIEDMPVAQVLLADMFLQDRIQSQAVAKWINFPFPQSYPKVLDARERQQQMLGFGLDHLAVATRADLSILLNSQAAAAHHMAMLQIVEILRMKAAETGELPTKLEEVTYPPVPDDPMTGRPFEYESDGEQAKLLSTYLHDRQGRTWTSEWKIQLAEQPTDQE